jgi:hypothetical protein
MNRLIGFIFTVLLLISAPLIALADSGWQFCANENDFCSFRGQAEVRYGAEGRYIYRTVTNGIGCSNDVFGDPTPGLAKNCFYKKKYFNKRLDRRGQFCANENEFCSFRGKAKVRYGAEGRYSYRIVTNGVSCSNSVFGDPAPGLEKRCFIME